MHVQFDLGLFARGSCSHATISVRFRPSIKTYRLAWPGKLPFNSLLHDENSQAINFLVSLFVLLCCIDVFKVKWFTSKSLSRFQESKH